MRKFEARNKVIAAALSCASNRFNEEHEVNNPHADAQAELDDEVLDSAIKDYVEADD